MILRTWATGIAMGILIAVVVAMIAFYMVLVENSGIDPTAARIFSLMLLAMGFLTLKFVWDSFDKTPQIDPLTRKARTIATKLVGIPTMIAANELTMLEDIDPVLYAVVIYEMDKLNKQANRYKALTSPPQNSGIMMTVNSMMQAAAEGADFEEVPALQPPKSPIDDYLDAFYELKRMERDNVEDKEKSDALEDRMAEAKSKMNSAEADWADYKATDYWKNLGE